MPILEVEHVKKIYSTRFGGQKVQALADVSFTVEKGEYVAIMGESGSGKTTLLNILAALDRPTAGSVVLDGMDLSRVKEGSMAAFRRDNLGFVFQDFSLLDTFSLRRRSWRYPSCWTSTPTRCPAARSSGARWPGPSSPGPSWCWPTSPPGRWTPARRRR